MVSFYSSDYLLLAITKVSTNQSLLETHAMHHLDSFYMIFVLYLLISYLIPNCVLHHHHMYSILEYVLQLD
jgi:hypothetical protein